MSERVSECVKQTLCSAPLNGRWTGGSERKNMYLLAQNTVDRIQNILIDMKLFSWDLAFHLKKKKEGEKVWKL